MELWTDPATALPSRVNARARQAHTRWVGAVGTEIEVTATVFSPLATGPNDAALGGRLFTASFAEHPNSVVPIASTAGTSSVQRFTPAKVGHYTLEMRRKNGGVVLLHVDVE